jgi:hypothetical protein
MAGWEKKCMLVLMWNETAWKTGIDGRLILKWILRV